jgi:hypothetical protein
VKLALVLAGLLAAAEARAEGVARFALVMGHNRPPRPDLPTLRYADDDAVRWSVLLRTHGARVELLTELDEESQRLYGTAVPAPAPPSSAAMTAAMARLAEAMRSARAAGQRTAFYFIYAGHGDSDDAGQGSLSLSDGPLSRAAFARQVLAASPADTNHVFIDACRAFYFVYDRGPGGTRQPFPGRYFGSGLASAFRNTGFLLATSSGAPSHEWEEFQAGIFSHEVRSALLGAADADGDGRIGYRELAAFLEVANRPVRNERYRPAFTIKAPLDGDGTLLDLGDATGGEILLPATADGHRLLEDPLGVRWADLNPAPGQAVTLRLPAPPWEAPQFFLRRPNGDGELRIPAGRRLSAAELPVERSATLRRGAAHEAFSHLFSLPFALDDVTSAPPLTVEAEAPPPPRVGALRRVGAWVAVGVGTIGLGTAGFLALDARRLADPHASGLSRPELNDGIASRNRWAVVSAASGALLVAAGAGVLIHDWRAAGHATATVTPLPGGGLASVMVRR